MTAPSIPRGRLLLLVLAGGSLLAGIWGGLLRLGWRIPLPWAPPLLHGPLMVGTLIGF